MANSVDLVIGQEAIKQVESLISKLSLADAELLKISQSASNASKGISGISTPSGLDKAVSSTASLNTQLEKQNTIITKLHADIAKKAEQSRLAEIRLQQAREKAFDSYERNAQKESALNAKNETAYQRIQNSVAVLTKTYQDLAIRKQLGSTLTAKEEAQLVTLTSRIKTYQDALLKTDATIGKSQRNVGNYASGYNALGNSISQLSREMPAFANSAQTGFMAISNNIPAFQDAIMQLRAGGMSWGGVVKEIGKSMFGLTGMISLATTLLVVLGPKIWDWIKGTDQAEIATKRLTGALKAQNEQLAINLKAIKYQEQVDVSLAKRAGASADEIARITGKSSRDQVDAAKKVTEGINNQIFAMQAYLALGTTKAKFDFLMRRNGNDKAKADAELFRREITYTTENLNTLLGARKKAYQEEKDLRDASVLQEIESATEIITSGNEINESKKENTKQEIESLRGTEKWYNEQIAKLKEVQSNTADTTNEYKAFTDQINLLEKALKLLKEGGAFEKPAMLDTSNEIIPTTLIETKDTIDPNAWMKQYAEDVKKAEAEMIALKEATDNWLNSFSSEFLQNSGFGSLETFFDGTFNKLLEGAETTEEKFAVTFNAIAESAQEAFNFISNASQANFDNERKRIEDQQAIAISYAGGSAVAIAKINEDAEKRKKDIANRENKAKQKQAIFNIAIDTAQAIMATVGKTGFAGLPLALILGALGAAQIAMVASQKIPQYFDGTDNHVGGMMLVNDGAGSNYQEKVILPNGKEIMPEGRNVLMNAPKGTKVLTHEQQIMQMLNERGVSMSKTYQSNGGMTANEMDSVMAKHFSKIQTNTTNIDKKGFSQWVGRNGNKTIQDNNRVSRTGFKV